MTRSPGEVVREYMAVVYGQRRPDRAGEFVAAETRRHYPGRVDRLTLDQTIARIEGWFAKFTDARFESAILIEQGEYVASVWNGWMTTRSGRSIEGAGLEIFRVVDGRIVEAWNQDPPGGAGLWRAGEGYPR